MNWRMIANQNDGIDSPITETTRPTASSAEFLRAADSTDGFSGVFASPRVR